MLSNRSHSERRAFAREESLYFLGPPVPPLRRSRVRPAPLKRFALQTCHPVDNLEGVVKAKEYAELRGATLLTWFGDPGRHASPLCESLSVEEWFHQPSMRPPTAAMIACSNIPPVRDARVPIQANGLACADHGMTRAALVVNDLGIGRLGAQHPVEPYRQLARGRYLGHSGWLMVAAVPILFAKLLIVPDR